MGLAMSYPTLHVDENDAKFPSIQRQSYHTIKTLACRLYFGLDSDFDLSFSMCKFCNLDVQILQFALDDPPPLLCAA